MLSSRLSSLSFRPRQVLRRHDGIDAGIGDGPGSCRWSGCARGHGGSAPFCRRAYPAGSYPGRKGRARSACRERHDAAGVSPPPHNPSPLQRRCLSLLVRFTSLRLCSVGLRRPERLVRSCHTPCSGKGCPPARCGCVPPKGSARGRATPWRRSKCPGCNSRTEAQH